MIALTDQYHTIAMKSDSTNQFKSI